MNLLTKFNLKKSSFESRILAKSSIAQKLDYVRKNKQIVKLPIDAER